MNDKCLYCKRDLLLDPHYRDKLYCDKYCRRNHIEQKNKALRFKAHPCVVCRKVVGVEEHRWFCSHACHLKYIEAPEEYCTLFSESTSLEKTAYKERRRLYRALHGELQTGMGIICTCRNSDCINASHLWLVTMIEAKNFWAKVRTDKIKELNLKG